MNTLSPSLHTPLRRQLTQYMRRCSSLQQPHRFLSTSQRFCAAATPLRNASRTPHEQYVRHKKSVALSAAGILVSAFAMYGTVYFYFPTEKDMIALKNNTNANQQGQNGVIKLDGPGGLDIDQPSTVYIDGVEQVSTGNGTVPNFPKTIQLPRSLDSTATRSDVAPKIGDEIDGEGGEGGEVEEYRLLGLGIRSVSILSIQVYVVGLYVATSDLPALQQRLVRKGATPVTAGEVNEDLISASSLVPGEREALKQLLLDPEKGEDAWADILKQGGLRTALRIVPTRNTDFLHLRDGWVRSITARAQKANARVKELAKKGDGDKTPQFEYADDSFGVALNDFKALLGGGVRKNVPKGQTLLLLRDRQGALEILYQAANGGRKPLTWLGDVKDERISRLMWMGYLSGKTVASDPARKSIIDGMMDIAGRPIGTLQQKVA